MQLLDKADQDEFIGVFVVEIVVKNFVVVVVLSLVFFSFLRFLFHRSCSLFCMSVSFSCLVKFLMLFSNFAW